MSLILVSFYENPREGQDDGNIIVEAPTVTAALEEFARVHGEDIKQGTVVYIFIIGKSTEAAHQASKGIHWSAPKKEK